MIHRVMVVEYEGNLGFLEILVVKGMVMMAMAMMAMTIPWLATQLELG